jgi:hypothetical protein
MYNFEILDDGQLRAFSERDRLKDALIAELKAEIANLEEQVRISDAIISKQDDVIARQDEHIKTVKEAWEQVKKDLLSELGRIK